MKAGARHVTMSVLLIALASAAQAQTSESTASAKGKVIGPNNQPQVGVPVTIEGPLGKTVAITDKSGMWSIYKLPAGEYKVKAISDNSAPVSFTVTETPFWNKVMGGKDVAVFSPEIKIDRAQN